MQTLFKLWAVFWYHDCSINWYRVVIMTHQSLRLGKCWKLFWATLNVCVALVSPEFGATMTRRLNQSRVSAVPQLNYPGSRGFLSFFLGKFCDANCFLYFFLLARSASISTSRRKFPNKKRIILKESLWGQGTVEPNCGRSTTSKLGLAR